LKKVSIRLRKLLSPLSLKLYYQNVERKAMEVLVLLFLLYPTYLETKQKYYTSFD